LFLSGMISYLSIQPESFMEQKVVSLMPKT
jgi:hypothetical protein